MRRTIVPLRRAAVGVSVAAMLTATAWAQHYHVHTYTEGDGLPSSTVYGMAQDPSGRMWFATRAGVAVYDGTEWTIFPHSDGPSLGNWQRLAVDDRGHIWVAGDRFDVARFDGERWFNIRRPELEAICQLRDLAVGGHGSAVSVVLATSCGSTVWDGERWRRLGLEHGLPDSRVLSLEHFDGRWYFGTTGGLSMLEPGANRFEPIELDVPSRPVVGMVLDTCGTSACLWLVGPDWIGRMEEDGFDLLAEGLDIVEGTEPQVTEADGAGGLFLGNHLVLYYFHPDRGLLFLDERNGLVAGGTDDLFRDREQNVWVSTARGVSKVLGFRFATLLEDHGLYEDEVSAVLERRDGSFVLGHRSGLTFADHEVDVASLQSMYLPESEHVDPGMGRVLDLAEDASGTVWIAGNELGLGRLVGDRVVWSPVGSDPIVSSVLVDSDNRLWVTTSVHVFVMKNGDFERVTVGEGFLTGVRRVFEGAKGSIYVLGMGGVHQLTDGVWVTRAHTRADINNTYSLLVRPDGAVWVGSAAGLAVLQDDALQPARTPLPAIDRPVYFMLADDDDRVWLGTDNGVLRWDGEELDHFTVEDGLGGRETNRAAGLLDSKGRVWIGTTHGVTLYHDELDRRVPVPPVVSLAGLEVSGETIPLDEPIQLGARRNDLVFRFRAVSFYDERNVRLRTRLEGYETGWSEGPALGGRFARFTNLPPGKYRFHVSAQSAAGAWSETASSPLIVIAPPLWGRPWFWFAMVLAASFLIYAGQRYVVQRRYARRLESEVAQRVAELRRAEAELAKAQRLEALGLLAGGIAHDFNNLLMVILGNISLVAERSGAKARKWLADAETAIERARQLTSQLLTFSRGGAPVRHTARICEIVRESASLVLHGSKVRSVIDLPEDLHVVHIDTGQISQVLNNLLINAMQAMPDGGEVHISGRNVRGMPGREDSMPFVAITVRDAGAGIPEHNLQRVFDPYFSTKEEGSGLGLTTAYSIASRHGGRLTVESEVGRGSAFTLYLPESSRQFEPEREPAPADVEFFGAHILVMDDDRDVRTAMGAMLESFGCAVTTSADGEQALRIYVEARSRGRPFDAVIVDLTVPGGMGGEKTLQNLLQIDPEVRAIVASGYANAPVMSEYRERGFQAVLRKPFRLDEIAEVLRQVLGRRVA